MDQLEVVAVLGAVRGQEAAVTVKGVGVRAAEVKAQEAAVRGRQVEMAVADWGQHSWLSAILRRTGIRHPRSRCLSVPCCRMALHS